MNSLINKYRWICICVMAFAFVHFSSCVKDTDDDDIKSDNPGISMKVDGKAWGTTINTLFTEEHESSELGVYSLVLVGGQRIDVEDSEDDVSSFNMYIAIPKSRFNNPKGAYAVLKDSEANVGQATASYTVSTGAGQTWYASYNPANPTQAVGTIEITGFEIGEQMMAGQATGLEGYTKLSGTFKMEVYPIQEKGGSVAEITEGKFNLKSGLGFDFK